MGPKSVSILEGILEPEKKNINFDSVGEDGAKIREHLGGDPKTEKKQKKSSRLRGMGPKSVRIFGGDPKTEKKTKKKTRLGWEGWVQNP